MTGNFSITTSPEKAPKNKLKTHHPLGGHGVTQFRAIDGEGMMVDGEHLYVLLAVGQDQISDPAGLHIDQILEFIYDHYEPRTAYVGFFLGYDFTQWIKTLPESRARMLLTKEGIASRNRTGKTKGDHKHLPPHPVNYGPWQFDMLGGKRFKLRKRDCICKLSVCEHKKGPWMYVCDVGGYFQTSFLNVINPKKWPEPIVTQDEYDTLVEGKSRRDVAILDDDMRKYNALENAILERVMQEYDKGLGAIGVRLPASKWFGPGQAAQTWMKGRSPKGEEVYAVMPDWFYEAAKASYYGGWFEIMMHGLVPGVSHEYDVNSAYPAIIANMPCLLHGTYYRGTGRIPRDKTGGRRLLLLRALVWTQAYDYKRIRYPIGAMLHRDGAGRISRPMITEGWFWEHELAAAKRAGLVTRIADDRCYEWVSYDPCDCRPPLWEMANLYLQRLRAGKDTPFGKGAKTVYNSGYGKFAQSVGKPIYGNSVYASFITAGCRTKILTAIATHPGGAANVCMVATDAVFFLDRHDGLDLSDSLGDWSYEARSNLTLFKPGVYWDDSTREAIRLGDVATFKARGINAKDFSAELGRIDDTFRGWNGIPPSIETMGEKSVGWPKVKFAPSFAMTTALQALQRNDWPQAGHVDSPGKEVTQSANPHAKRTDVYYDPERNVYRSQPHWFAANSGFFGDPAKMVAKSEPYVKRFGMEDPWSEENLSANGIDQDGYVGDAYRFLTGKG